MVEGKNIIKSAGLFHMSSVLLAVKQFTSTCGLLLANHLNMRLEFHLNFQFTVGYSIQHVVVNLTFSLL